MFLLFVLFILYSCSGLKTKQGDSASLFGYRSCYDPRRVRDLTSGIRAYALVRGSRLIDRNKKFSCASFQIFSKNNLKTEEQLEDCKNRRKPYVLICFGVGFELFACLLLDSKRGVRVWAVVPSQKLVNQTAKSETCKVRLYEFRV